MSKGPVAPKDPTMKKPFFYIMQDKEIFGAKQPNGKGVQFVYQNDGRLLDSAKIAGNVTNEEHLELLKTTQGFRKLVYAIGVSVMATQQEEKVRFVYQMYGNKDTYGSGSNLVVDLQANGVEQLIVLDEVNWSEDDKEPGQIRFEFENCGVLATANVRLYLQDGYEAPEQIADEEIDHSTPQYRQMIERSLMQLGNTARLQKAIRKAQQKEDITIAYIGGSITQGAGAIPIHQQCYAYKSYQAFCELYGDKEHIHFVKAGVGGTPSELGMIRYERDVLRDGTVSPDVVVIEFAVNDEGDETNGVCYESLVRKALAHPNKPAVVLLFSVFSYDWNLQERLRVVGEQYQLPMVSVKDAVTPQFALRKEEGRVLSKNQFFYDIYHPSNAGHQIMAECLANLWKKAMEAPEMVDETEQYLNRPETAIGKTFENVKLLDRKDMPAGVKVEAGSFMETDKELQCVEMDDRLEFVPEFPYNWMRKKSVEGVKDCFEMTITCKALLIIAKDSAAPQVGRAEVWVDGTKRLTVDPHLNGWTHCNALIALDEEESLQHEVRVQMVAGDEEKEFTILGFGYVE